MIKIIFLTLFLFVSNYFQVWLPHGSTGVLKKSNNEYIAIYDEYASHSNTYTIKVEYENISVIDEKYFDRAHYGDTTFDPLLINDNLIFYGLMFQITVENNGKMNDIIFGGYFSEIRRFQVQAFSNDRLVICTWIYNHSLYYSTGDNTDRYDYKLHLIKEPYVEISNSIEIETLSKDDWLYLIGLKDYFVFIKIDESEEEKGSGNITYKFLDLDLNLVDTLSYEYKNYSDITFLNLSRTGKVNEFLVCILKDEDRSEELNTYKCQLVKYENHNLKNIQTINIDIIGDDYDLLTYFFDENKIIFYFYDLYDHDYDYINILQYENQALSYYKYFKNFSLPKLIHKRSSLYHTADFVMTEQGLGVIYLQELYYLSSICVPKTITLYSNELLDFPIEEIIYPGIDPLQFSFDEISEFITIYKDSTEIKTGQIFNNLDGFTYFLKIDKIFKDIKLRIKNHEFDFICNINIEVYINTNISTYKDTQKCLKNNDYEEINNIVYSNLYDYFTIKEERIITIELELEREPKGNELRFYFDDNIQDYFDDNSGLLCKHNSTRIICDKIPISVLPKLKRIHLYSYLSCYNLVDVGWFELNDKNIFNIYSLIYEDFDEISKIYEPERNISEYNPAMINYYYWFSCLSYCDDEKIEQKNCCNNILDKWEIVFHKEYDYEEGILKKILEKLYEIVEKIIKETMKKFSTRNSDIPHTDNPRTDRPNDDNSRTDIHNDDRTDRPQDDNHRSDRPQDDNHRTDRPKMIILELIDPMMIIIELIDLTMILELIDLTMTEVILLKLIILKILTLLILLKSKDLLVNSLMNLKLNRLIIYKI